MTAKLIHTNGPFEVYKFKGVLIINENGEFKCNLRKTDNGYCDPAGWVAKVIASRIEATAEWAAVSEERKARVDAYLSARRDRAAAQPQFAW